MRSEKNDSLALEATNPRGFDLPAAVRRFMLLVVGAQAVAVAALSIHRLAPDAYARIAAVGGTATVPLLLCIVVLIGAAIGLALHRAGAISLAERQVRRLDRALVYAGRIAWMLGLLQTMLSLYAVRGIFAAQLEYEEMVARLGDISGSAYGSSLIGGGTLLLGWILQLVLTGRLRD
jgi:hypothetical protein